MKKTQFARKMAACFMAWMLTVSSGAMADDASQGGNSVKFSKEELAQMLAPVALYPDPLLAQILMASTYPLEVVEADRWVKKNPGLKGDALDAALKDQDWDVSVKSLAHFPDVLSRMSENLDQTSRLGDAFLAQQADVMDEVQALRAKAQEKGNLKSTNEQKVIVQEKTIVIQPANPEVIYVPTYSPTVVYGPWWYPAYPPYPPWYPGAGFVAFSAGVFVGAAAAGWCNFGWHDHDVNINVNRTANFNRNVNIHGGNHGPDSQAWTHDPGHRHGVAYRDQATSQRFAQPPSRSSQARGETRGYDGGGSDRRAADFQGKDVDRPKLDSQRGKIHDQAPGSLERSGDGTGTDRKGSGPSERGAFDRDQSVPRDRGGFGGGTTSAFGGMSDRRSSSMASDRGMSSRGGGSSAGHGGGGFGGHGGGGRMR